MAAARRRKRWILRIQQVFIPASGRGRGGGGGGGRGGGGGGAVRCGRQVHASGRRTVHTRGEAGGPKGQRGENNNNNNNIIICV